MLYEEDRFVLICDRDLRYARHLQEFMLSEGGLACNVRILTEPGRAAARALPAPSANGL